MTEVSLETVWIKLNTFDEVIGQGYDLSTLASPRTTKEEIFMFGTGGVTRFKTFNGVTTLSNQSGPIAFVEEHMAYIMDILGKMRGTKGKLHGEEMLTEKEESSATPEECKVEDKV